MFKPVKTIILTLTHLATGIVGFALGIYLLPVLTAPDGPDSRSIRNTAEEATFRGEVRRDLEDSDALHWGDGTLYLSADNIAFEGRLSPGPDYRLYLSPRFVETEADFEALKSEMAEVGHVFTFENFMLDVPESIDPAEYKAAIVWCESFGQFITAAAYQ